MKIDLINSYKFGFVVDFPNFFVHLYIFIGLIYGRTIIIACDYTNIGGKITSTVLCALIAISVIIAIKANFKTIFEAKKTKIVN